MNDSVYVILLEDVSDLGRAGSIVKVSDGYARNFLFPEGKAALATPKAREQKKDEDVKKTKEAELELQVLQEKADKFQGTELTLPAKVKEGVEIYGSITADDIAHEVNEQTGLSIKTKDVRLKKSITQVGSQDIEIHLSREISFTIRVTIIPDEKK